MRSDMDHTVLPANYTMPAFTPQPQNITALWLVLGLHCVPFPIPILILKINFISFHGGPVVFPFHRESHIPISFWPILRRVNVVCIKHIGLSAFLLSQTSNRLDCYGLSLLTVVL